MGRGRKKTLELVLYNHKIKSPGFSSPAGALYLLGCLAKAYYLISTVARITYGTLFRLATRVLNWDGSVP